MTDGFVTVYATDDPLQGEMLVDLLKQEGLDARLLGMRYGSSIGLGQHAVRLRIEVPAAQVPHAARWIEAWEQGVPETDEGAENEEPEEPAAPPRLSAVLAAGSAIVPGGSHFYARRAWTGGLLAAGIVVSIVTIVIGDRLEASAGALTLAGLVIFDVAFGQVSVRAFNLGRRRGAWTQVLIGAAALFVCGGAGALVAPHMPEKRAPVFRFADPIELRAVPAE